MPYCTNVFADMVAQANYNGGNGVVKSYGDYTVDMSGDWRFREDDKAVNLESNGKQYIDLFKDVGRHANVDWRLIAAHAYCESSFVKCAKSSKSTATGLWQYIKSTWQSCCKKYGYPQYAELSNRCDVEKMEKVYKQHLRFLITNDAKNGKDYPNKICLALQSFHDGSVDKKTTEWATRKETKADKEEREYVSRIIEKYHSYGG